MKKTSSPLKFLLWVLVLMLGMSAALAVPAPSDDFYVLDQADVLSDETEGLIVLNNDTLYKACGAQIVVVTIDTTGDVELEDYAWTLFNAWGIGSSNEENGVLVLLVIGDDTYYVMQGRGLEDTLTSGTLGNLNATYLEPYFARKEYDKGTAALFAQLFQRVAAIYGADVTLDETAYDNYLASLFQELEQSPEPARKTQTRSGSFRTVFWIAMIFIGLLVIIILRRSRKQSAARSDAAPKTFSNSLPSHPPASGSSSVPPVSSPPAPSRSIPPIPPIPPVKSHSFFGRSSGRSIWSTSTPAPKPARPRSSGGSILFGGSSAPKSSSKPASGGARGSKPGMSSRSGGFGASSRSSIGRSAGSFSSGRSSSPSRPSSPRRSGGGFGGGRTGGGGSSRGGGAGRGRSR